MHTHLRSTAQHTCSVAILSSKRRERNIRTRALSWQSLLQDSPHSGTHTHAPKHTHTHTHMHTYTHAHGHRGARHTHTHCDDPIPIAAVFFAVFGAPHLADTMGLSGDGAISSPRALGPSKGSPLATVAECASSSAPAWEGVDMRISSGICGPNWDWKPRAGRGSRRAGKTSTRVRSSPNPEPTRPGFRGCSEGRSAMCERRDAQIRKRRGRRQVGGKQHLREASTGGHTQVMTRTLCRERERERRGGCPVCTTLMVLRTLSCRWRSSRTSCAEERRAIHPSSSRASALVSALAHLGCNKRTPAHIAQRPTRHRYTVTAHGTSDRLERRGG